MAKRHGYSARDGAAVVLAGLMCLGWARAASANGFLVRDGEAAAEIVIADNPPRTTDLAARELQRYVLKMTGAELPIVTEPGSLGVAKVHVGESAFTQGRGLSSDELDFGAFKMLSEPDHLILFGRDTEFTPPERYIEYEAGRPSSYEEWDRLTGGKYGNPVSAGRGYNSALGIWNQDGRGSLNAVYGFLRSLGVRWYFPGEIGEVTPTLSDIPIPAVNETVRPDFGMRRLFFYYNTFGHDRTGEEALWQMRLALNSGHESFGSSSYGHGLQNVHRRDKSDPTMFALLGGERSVESHGGIGSPCLSSEAFFESTVKYARAVLDIYPDEPVVDIAPVDGYANLCQCDACQAKGTPERGWTGRMSDYVWDFTDRVARELMKTHPDRKINALAYSGYLLPPENIEELSPNISVILCRWRANFDDPETHDFYRQVTRDWLEKIPSGEFYIWDYYLHSRPGGPWEGVPVYFTQIIADDLGFLKGKSRGEFIEVSRNWPAWGIEWHALASNHLNVYVTSRLYWDADQDLGTLLDEYYEKFYGPAASEMRAFVEYAEGNARNATRDAEVIDRLNELLLAGREAAGDSVYGERVELLVDFIQPLLGRRDELARGRDDAPTARAHRRAAADITLDGRLDEPFWEGLEEYWLKEIVTGEEPENRTSLRMGWVGDSLYLGIVCYDADMENLNITATEDGDTALFNGDSIEILLETQTHAYYQIAIGPNGVLVDLDRRRGINSLWSSQAEVGAHIGEDYWSLEVRIPVAGEAQAAIDPNNGVAGRQPTEEHPWFFNVCRQRMRPGARDLSAFSPTGRAGFHVPMRFGELHAR